MTVHCAMQQHTLLTLQHKARLKDTGPRGSINAYIMMVCGGKRECAVKMIIIQFINHL